MMKRQALRCVFLLFAAFFALGAYAHAGRITVKNNTNYDIRMAFKFYDYERNMWVVWGWYTVPSRSSKSYNFKIARDKKIYWYGKTGDGKRYWPGNGDHGQSVILRKMDGLKADTVKEYSEAKVVQFKTSSSNGTGNLTITLR